MKLESSGARLPALRWLAVLCVLGACSKSEPVTLPKAEYRYEIRSVFIKQQPSFETRSARFTLDGKPVGRNSFDSPTDFKVPAAQLLVGTGSRLRLEVASTCGPLQLPLEVFTESGKSEADERKEADRAPLGHIIGLRVNYTGPWVREGQVLVDNVGNPGKQTVQVGTMTLEVADGAGPPVKFGDRTAPSGWAARTLPLGTCDAGLDISHNGKTLGRVAPPGLATLVDLTGGHCYLRQPHIYVREGADPTKAPKAGPAEVLLPKPGQHVQAVGEVFNVAGVADRLISVSDRDFEEHTSLERIRCPKAANAAKKKRR